MRTLAHNPFLRIAHKSLACILAFCIVNMPVWALNAGDAVVSAGNASISGAANTVSVDLISNRAVLDWSQMNAANHEILSFTGSSGFAVLNRVASAVDFNGGLNGAGGHIFVVSPYGVLIGPDASITASSFTASSLNITNTDFMNSIYRFSGDGIGEVANYGHISARQVALIGKKVLNAGTISSPGGYTILAAGDSVYLNPEGSDVMIEVAGVIIPEGSEGQGIGDVVNEGTIQAIDGQIILAAGDTFSRAIDGIEGMTVAVESGTGRVGQFGTLSANGSDSNGGSIMLTAADAVVLGSDSVTTANAGANGDGGDVVVYSPDTAIFRDGAVVEAKGGSESGDGGFFELSGKNYVEVAGDIDLIAQNGEAGNFLLDPRNIKIVDDGLNEGDFSGSGIWEPKNWWGQGDSAFSKLGIEQLNSYLAMSNVTLETDYWSLWQNIGGGQSGWVIFDASSDVFTAPGNGYSLTVNAEDYIQFNPACGINFQGHGNVTLNATSDIIINAPISMNGALEAYTYKGDIAINNNVTAGSIFMMAGDPSAGDTGSFLDATSDADNTLYATTGDLIVWARESIDFGGDVKADSGNVELTADYDMLGKGDLEVDGTVEAAGNVNLTGRMVTLNDDVYAGGNMTVKALENIGYGGGVIETHGALTTGNGDISLMVKDTWKFRGNGGELGYLTDGQIKLGGDVTANGKYADIKVYNNTESTVDNLTMQAGQHIIFGNAGYPGVAGVSDGAADTLQGKKALTLTAGADPSVHYGEIFAEKTTISMTGSTVTLKQDPMLNTKNFMFTGQGDINLTLISNEGSVVSDLEKAANAADKWASIGATAKDDITLEGNGSILLGDSGTDSTKSVVTRIGDIDVISGHNVDATKDIKAGDDLRISAKHDINLQAAESGDDMTMDAGDDIRLKQNVSSGGNIDLNAHDELELNMNSGNTTAVGKIDLRSGDSTTLLYDDVTGGADVTMHNNTIVKEAGVTIRSTGDDVILKANKTLTSEYDLTLAAADDVKLGVFNQNGMNGSGGNVLAENDLIITAGDDIYAHGTLTTNNGMIQLNASDNTIYLWDDVTANGGEGVGDLELNANTWTGPGTIHLYAGDDIEGNGTITASDSLDVESGDNIRLRENVDVANNFTGFSGNGMEFNADGGEVQAGNIDLVASSTIQAHENMTADHYLYLETGNGLIVDGGKKLEAVNQDVKIIGNTIGQGDLTIKAGDDLRAYGNIDADGHLAMYSDTVSGNESEMRVKGNITAYTMSLKAGTDTVDGTNRDRIRIYGDVESTRGDTELISDDHIYVQGDVTAANDAKLIGNNDHPAGGIVGDVTVTGDVFVNNDIIAEGRNVSIYGQATAGNNVEIDAVDYGFNGSDGDVYVGDGIQSGWNVLINATDDITLGTTDGVSAEADNDIILKADLGNYAAPYGGDVTVYGDLLAGNNIEIDAADNTIYLYGDAYADNHVKLMANTKLKGEGDQTIEAGSYIEADGYVRKCKWGDLWLMGWGENEAGQSLNLLYDEGCGPAVSTFEGNLWMIGARDIQISGDVTTFGPYCCGWTPDTCGDWNTGGVLIYAMDGSIYTGAVENGLNVNVTGNSDHWRGLGVYNPEMVGNDGIDDDADLKLDVYEMLGRAAIAIVSSKDLKLGPDGSLNAFGKYYDGGEGGYPEVDDRYMINFLDTPEGDPDAEFPPGTPRDEGDPFDLAIYVASLDGNVEVDMPTQIRSASFVPYDQEPSNGNIVARSESVGREEGYWVCEPKGTMVIDAMDSVFFGSNFEASLLGDGETSDVGDRLEVVSRITEWLEEAIEFGRLPYADQWTNPETGPNPPFPDGYSYVLRGAGLENEDIVDGRAWVLESRGIDAAPLQLLETPQLNGCPAVMEAAATELAVNSDGLQLLIANSLASNVNLQPCDACENLLQAAAALRSINEERLAAMNQIFNTLAPVDAPFTPEVSASVQTAFANFREKDTQLAAMSDAEYQEYQQYAMADEIIDAFVSYVAVLDNDLKLPVGDAMALVMDKYFEPIAASGNPNIGAYILEQIQASQAAGETIVASAN